MTTKDAYIEHLENTIKDLQDQINNLNEMLLLLRKEKFGSSSEKTPNHQIDGQLSLFNEAEAEADPAVPEPIEKDVHGYKRRVGKTKRDESFIGIPKFGSERDVSEICEQRAAIPAGEGLGAVGDFTQPCNHGKLGHPVFGRLPDASGRPSSKAPVGTGYHSL